MNNFSFEFGRYYLPTCSLSFAQTCSALIASGISVSDFSAFFLPRLEPLASDPVVNVRIAASRTVRALCMTGIVYFNTFSEPCSSY